MGGWAKGGWGGLRVNAERLTDTGTLTNTNTITTKKKKGRMNASSNAHFHTISVGSSRSFSLHHTPFGK